MTFRLAIRHQLIRAAVVESPAVLSTITQALEFAVLACEPGCAGYHYEACDALDVAADEVSVDSFGTARACRDIATHWRKRGHQPDPSEALEALIAETREPDEAAHFRSEA